MSNQLAAELDDLDLLSQAVEIAESLDLAGLLELQDKVDDLVNDRMAQDLGSSEASQDGDVLPKSCEGGNCPPTTGRPCGSWIELKMIPRNGRQYGPYAYQRWRENGRQRSKYLGKVKEVA